MNFFEKNKNKIKKISAGLCPAPPNVTPQNLCLQGKLMPLTLRSAQDGGCRSVAAHVHCETISDAVRPVLAVRPAVLKSSEVCSVLL